MSTVTVFRVTWSRGGRSKAKRFGSLAAARKQYDKVLKPYHVTEAYAKSHKWVKAGYVEGADWARIDFAPVTWVELPVPSDAAPEPRPKRPHRGSPLVNRGG